MKIKGVYYLKNEPLKLAVVLVDNRVGVANVDPLRLITEKELDFRPIYNNEVYRHHALTDEIPDYYWHWYGFEKA